MIRMPSNYNKNGDLLEKPKQNEFDAAVTFICRSRDDVDPRNMSTSLYLANRGLSWSIEFGEMEGVTPGVLFAMGEKISNFAIANNSKENGRSALKVLGVMAMDPNNIPMVFENVRRIARDIDPARVDAHFAKNLIYMAIHCVQKNENLLSPQLIAEFMRFERLDPTPTRYERLCALFKRKTAGPKLSPYEVKVNQGLFHLSSIYEATRLQKEGAVPPRTTIVL